MNAVPQFRATLTIHIVFKFSLEQRYSDLLFYFSLTVFASKSKVEFGIILKIMSEGHNRCTFMDQENAIMLKHFFALTTVQVSLPSAVLPLCYPLKNTCRLY